MFELLSCFQKHQYLMTWEWDSTIDCLSSGMYVFLVVFKRFIPLCCFLKFVVSREVWFLVRAFPSPHIQAWCSKATQRYLDVQVQTEQHTMDHVTLYIEHLSSQSCIIEIAAGERIVNGIYDGMYHEVHCYHTLCVLSEVRLGCEMFLHIKNLQLEKVCWSCQNVAAPQAGVGEDPGSSYGSGWGPVPGPRWSVQDPVCGAGCGQREHPACCNKREDRHRGREAPRSTSRKSTCGSCGEHCHLIFISFHTSKHSVE